MPSQILPIFMILFVWCVVALSIAAARKASVSGKKPAARPNLPEQGPASGAAPAPEAERPVRITPTVFPTGHDDSIYQGSMNAVTGEGYDPCHEEQLQSLSDAEQPAESQPSPHAAGGIPLRWTGNDVVRGIVMSEILKRKR